MALSVLFLSFSFTLWKSSMACLLVAEHLDYLLTVQHLLNKAVHSSQIDLLADIVFSGQSGKIWMSQKA